MRQSAQVSVLLFILTIIVAASWWKPLDKAAGVQVNTGFERAAITFAGARMLNGVISVVQGTEISISPGGLGATLTPGQILDPVNDLVEQFSELMLFATMAFGIMKILLEIGSFWIFSAILSGVALAWAGITITNRVPPILLTKILLVLIFVRFSVPLVSVGSDMLFQQFLAKDFNEHKAAIDNSQKAIDSTMKQLISLGPQPDTSPAPVAAMNFPTSNPPPVPNNGYLARATEFIKGVPKAAVDMVQTIKSLPQIVENKFEQYKQKYHSAVENLKMQTSELATHIIKLMVVFVLQTVIIPLSLMWMLYRLCSALIDSAGRRGESKAA